MDANGPKVLAQRLIAAWLQAHRHPGHQTPRRDAEWAGKLCNEGPHLRRIVLVDIKFVRIGPKVVTQMREQVVIELLELHRVEVLNELKGRGKPRVVWISLLVEQGRGREELLLFVRSQLVERDRLGQKGYQFLTQGRGAGLRA